VPSANWQIPIILQCSFIDILYVACYILDSLLKISFVLIYEMICRWIEKYKQKIEEKREFSSYTIFNNCFIFIKMNNRILKMFIKFVYYFFYINLRFNFQNRNKKYNMLSSGAPFGVSQGIHWRPYFFP